MARKSATRKAADAAANAQAQANSTRKTIVIAVTPEWFDRITQTAKDESVSVSALIGRYVGNAYGVATVAPARAAKTRKYATKEEAKKAQAQKAKERNAKMTKLYKLFLEGKIDPAVLAKVA